AEFLKRVEPLVSVVHSPCAILSVDIDRFRQLSVSLDAEDTEQLFRQLVERLKHEIRANDVIERTGRDGFAIFVAGIGSDKRVAGLCQRLLAAAHEPFSIAGRSVLIKLSIGIATESFGSLPLPELVRRADVALQFQKASGGSGFSTFTPSLG